MRRSVDVVEFLQQIETVSLLLLTHELGRRLIEDRLRGGAEGRALINRRQEAGAPVDRTGARLALASVEHHIGRQIGIGRAERIDDPGSERRSAGADVAGVELQDRDVMGGADRNARLYECELVGVLGDVGQPVGKPGAALPILLPCARRGEELADAALRAGLDAFEEGLRDLLAGETNELRLIVVEVQTARRAVHMQPDDGFHLRREMGRLRR